MKSQIQLLTEAKAQLEASVPTSPLINEIAAVLKEPELPFNDGYPVSDGVLSTGPFTPLPAPPKEPYTKLPADKTFDGASYEEDLDKERLSKQIDRIFEFMKPGQWSTLKEISIATGAPEASASACLRDFRKERNGSHIVEKRRRGEPKNGLFEYKLILNTTGRSAVSPEDTSAAVGSN